MIVDRDVLEELAVLRREHQQLVQANEWWRVECAKLQRQLDDERAINAAMRVQLDAAIKDMTDELGIELQPTPTRAAAPPPAGSRVAPPADAIGVPSAGKSGPPVEERPPVRSGAAPGP